MATTVDGQPPTGLSKRVLITLFAIVLTVRLFTLTTNELGWDVFGYYLHLPATFIHHDPLLRDIGWVHEVRSTYDTSATLYQLAEGPRGGMVYFFLMGMALLYLPFFLLAHALALLTGAPADGFSPVYQYTVAIGMLTYVWIGLVHLRRTLLALFTERITAALLVIVVLGTNYLHFMGVKSPETAGALFCLMAVLVWNTLRWHQEQHRSNLMWAACCCALITLVKPSEVFCLLVPLLWGVYDRASLRWKIGLLRTRWKDLLLAIALAAVLVMPQLLYWKTVTGQFLYDSYRNPGVGLDWWAPHILETLFSARKGWLVYTPVMALALVGLVPLWRRRRALFWPVLLTVAVSFYIIASWSEWWYGASYSVRPMITHYVLLAIPLGCVVERVLEARRAVRGIALAGIGLLVALNLFQTWQFNRWIIHPYRTTWPYYRQVFGRITFNEEWKKLLSVDHDYSGTDVLKDTTRYRRVDLARITLDDLAQRGDHRLRFDSLLIGHALLLDPNARSTPAFIIRYDSLTTHDHAWIEARMKVRVPDDGAAPHLGLVATMSRKEGVYGYREAWLDASSARPGEWSLLSHTYLTPYIRERTDHLYVYGWYHGPDQVEVGDLVVTGWVPKDP